MHEPPRRPEVTLIRSSAPLTAEPETAPPPARRRTGLVAALVAGLLLLVVGTSTTGGGEPAPPAPVEASLVLLVESLTITQGGILVIPLELRNTGPALRVRSAAAYAEPVLDDPVVQAPDDVDAGASRRFVALVAPDCRLLRPGSPFRFSATVMLQVGLGSSSRRLMVDLAAAPAVRETVAGLCRV